MAAAFPLLSNLIGCGAILGHHEVARGPVETSFFLKEPRFFFAPLSFWLTFPAALVYFQVMNAGNGSANWSDWDDGYWGEDPDYDQQRGSQKLKESLNLAAMVLYGLVFLVGIPGNGAVIWIVGFQMRKRPNTIWFLNLSVADLLCCLSLPFLVSHLALGYHWPYGWFLCKAISSATILSMFASVFVLTGLSIDRCLATVFPVWSRNKRTVKRVAAACGLAWALAFLMCLPSFIYRGTIALETKVYCVNSYGGTDEANRRSDCQVQVTRFAFGFLLPFLVIGACSALLVLKVKGSRCTVPKKVFKLVAAVVLSFFVCWLPYHVVGVLLCWDLELTQRVLVAESLVTGLAYMNSCVNPALYVFVGRGFKEQLRKSLRDIFEGAFKDEASGLQSRLKPSAVPSQSMAVLERGVQSRPEN